MLVIVCYIIDSFLFAGGRLGSVNVRERGDGGERAPKGQGQVVTVRYAASRYARS